ncbi:glycosyltransferase family 4 protein [Cyanobacterium stanieri LEGE 03274]|uniref:Glycosyltransferase family 4 protein n=1 Tax=Cyanobacterium stanieri LEGE 03274 TaxID=1828756 RepID=A0ABR9V448_9CHRO|nr:hormogonium polysaccharide biosynthesis glycosyltransferase HpsO [Cyanobacterium stanieri]MBE9221916.1 glycosyltransferase family 4 protein [Cyanobacterium stanieri LEGE 03274]
MNILVVGHSYIVDLNCEKLRELAKISPEIQVRVVVPKIWNPGGVQNKIITSEFKDEGNFKIIPITNYSQNHQGLLTFSPEIISFLKDFKPHIIHVEQGIKSFAYAQLIILNKILGLKAKNFFFTWWNIPYDLKFPFSWLEKFNLNNTHGFIAGNQDALDIINDHGYRGKSVVMPNLGIDDILFAPKKEPYLKDEIGIKNNEFVIGFVGRFVSEKGILTLIKAVSSLENNHWKLLLLGRGELEQKIIEEVTKLGLKDKLIIIPSVAHNQVPRYINLMDTLVLPSQTDESFKTISAKGWKEQFGHVLIEAMACKVPVIGSNSGEIPYVIGDDGLVFQEKDDKGLKDCLEQLMNNPDLARDLGERGYQKTMEKYTNKALARDLLKFYEQVLMS